jgi:hypothetical protein
LNKDYCYKGGKKLTVEAAPIKLAIGTVTLTSDLTLLWLEHNKELDKELDKLKSETNFEYNHIIIKDLPIAEARQKIVEEALKDGYSHLLFLDSDTFIPKGALEYLLQTAVNFDIQVVCLPVYLKRMPLISNIYQDMMFAPLAKLPRERFKIDLTGLAACLIDLNVFSKIAEPYFVGKWKVVNAKGINFHINTSEDTAFFYKLKMANIDVYCDPKYICEHYDKQKDLFFPSLINKNCYEVK